MTRSPLVPAALAAAAALVLASLAPAASATWSRELEPDTWEDRAGGWMWGSLDAFRSWEERVYFDVIPTWGTVGGPNVGVRALGSEVVSPAVLSFQAFLGYWKDCNRDGYIGELSTGLMTYRIEGLLQHDLCPWNSFHAQDGWVTELMWIGPSFCEKDANGNPTWCWCPTGTGCQDEVDFSRFVDDGYHTCWYGPCRYAHTLVWSDFGRPWERREPSEDLVPARHGSFSSWGGTADWADLAAGHRVSGAADGLRAGGVDGYVENETGLLRMPTQYHPVSPWWNLANDIVKPFVPDWAGLRGTLDGLEHPREADVGSLYNDSEDYEQDGSAMVEVWDCESPGGTEGVLPGTRDELFAIPSIGVPPGSLEPTVDHAGKGLTGLFYERQDSRYCGRDPQAMPYPYVEEPEPTTPLKHAADIRYYFTPPRILPQTDDVWGGTSTDPTQSYASPAGWFSIEQFVGWPIPAGYGYTVDTYVTSYADIKYDRYYGLAHGWSSYYGAEACGAYSSERNGWSCDRDEWPRTSTWDARVWELYDVRDTDCFSASLTDPPRPDLPALPDPADPQPPAPTLPDPLPGTTVRVGRCG